MLTVLFLLGLLQPADAPYTEYVVNTRWSETGSLSGRVEGFDLISRSGEKLWGIEVNQPAFLEQLKGGCAIIIRELAPEVSKVSLEFLDSTGSVQSTIKVDHLFGIDISGDREKVLVNCSNGLSLFSSDGGIVCEYRGVFRKTAVDEFGCHVAMTGSDSLFVFCGKKKLVAIRLPNSYVREVVLADSGEKTAILTSSSVGLWGVREGCRFLDLSEYESSPTHVSVSKSGKKVLVILRGENDLKFLTVDTDDFSTHLSTVPLSSPDETVIRILTEEDGWLINLTSGWFRFTEAQK